MTAHRKRLILLLEQLRLVEIGREAPSPSLPRTRCATNRLASNAHVIEHNLLRAERTFVLDPIRIPGARAYPATNAATMLFCPAGKAPTTEPLLQRHTPPAFGSAVWLALSEPSTPFSRVHSLAIQQPFHRRAVHDAGKRHRVGPSLVSAGVQIETGGPAAARILDFVRSPRFGNRNL